MFTAEVLVLVLYLYLFFNCFNIVAASPIIEKEGDHDGYPPSARVHTPTLLFSVVVDEKAPIQIQIAVYAVDKKSHKEHKME